MKDFRLFDITDFVLDEDFIRWVHEKREEDEIFWNNWLRQHSEKHLAIAEARRILESLKTAESPVPDHVVTYEVERLLQTIREQHEPSLQTVRSRHTWWYAAAAAIILTVASVKYFSFSSKTSTSKFSYAALTADRRLIENVNTSNTPVHLALPDGSSIELAPQSRISYANNFDSAGSRDIYLSGEAFFNVARSPNRPFRVYANDIVTKVLGTSFSVRSFDADTVIQVIVRTGKVSVSSHSDDDGGNAADASSDEVILAPNQRLVYGKNAQKFQKVLLENPVMTVPAEADRNMVYDDAPLDNVFNAIAKAYDITIVYDSELLQHCTVTADLRHEPFYRKLDLVCRAIGATYELIDGQVVIQAGGCN